MSEAVQDRDPSSEGPFDHEIRFKTLVALGLGLAVLTGVAALLMWFMYFFFLDLEKERDAPPPVLEEAGLPVQVPGPKLLATPERELQRVRTEEDEVLTSYGWIDQPQGLARIPVQRALEIVAARGLADTTEEAEERLPGQEAAGDASAAPSEVATP